MEYNNDIQDDFVQEVQHIKEVVARNIRKHRQDRHLTQERLAEESGVATITIVKLEHEQLWPSARTLVAIAKSLNIKPYELYYDEYTDVVLPKERVFSVLERIKQELSQETSFPSGTTVQPDTDANYSITHKS